MRRKPRYAGGLGARLTLVGATLFLLFTGLVMVYSASSVADYVNLSDSSYHLKRHALLILVGGLLAVGAGSVDYNRLRRWSWGVYAVSLLGLGIVFMAGVGKWGATRWIDLGVFTIQPSEYAKLACVLVTAHLVTSLQRGEIASNHFWGRVFLVFASVAALVMAQPDMGTTVSIAIAMYIVLLLGGVDWKVLVGTTTAGVGLAAAAILLAPYRATRLFAFLDPWADPQGAGYQSIQAMLAFGSGGLSGVGLGMSRQKYFYLPAAHTDFIFAIIGEELGLLGTLSIVVAFIVFAYAGVRIALGAKDSFGRLVAGGLTGMIVTQALMNMAAVTGLMPVTGIPLPLVSSGGSSLTFTMLCVGIILSVSSHGARSVRPVRARIDDEEHTRARDSERRGNRRAHLSGVGRSSGVARRGA